MDNGKNKQSQLAWDAYQLQNTIFYPDYMASNAPRTTIWKSWIQMIPGLTNANACPKKNANAAMPTMALALTNRHAMPPCLLGPLLDISTSPATRVHTERFTMGISDNFTNDEPLVWTIAFMTQMTTSKRCLAN
jgi:hypothetical protein